MGQPASKPAVTLYHYTDKEGKDAILNSRFIKMSTDTRLDAVLGEGVYMTSMSPFENTRGAIIYNNWRAPPSNKVKYKTQYVFKVEVMGSNLKSHKAGDRDIYVFGLENLELDLVEDWTLYDWTSETPTPILTGKFTVPKLFAAAAGAYQYM